MNYPMGPRGYGGYGAFGGSPNNLQTMYRLKMAQMLADPPDTPVYSVGQGMTRALAEALGTWKSNQILKGLDDKQQAATDERNAAFTQQMPDAGVAGPRVGTGHAPSSMEIAQKLAGSNDPRNAAMGMDLYTRGLDRQQANEDWQNRFQIQDKAANARQDALFSQQRQLHQESEAAAERRAKLALGAKQPETVTTADGIFILNSDGTLGNRLGSSPKTQAGLSPTAQKELFEADDVVNQATSAEDALTKALALNDKAFSGAGAGARTWYARNAPEALGGDPASAANSTQFNQLVTEQALQSLKAIFGGNPTEGERAILLDMQAAPSMSQQERKTLLSRAIQALQARRQFASSRAQQLREGTYFKSEGGPAVAAPSVMPGGSGAGNKAFVYNPTTGSLDPR
jgi:hypothetical protein